MPVQLFTEAERAQRDRFPEVIAYEDLVIFFTLSERDHQSLPRSSAPHNRLGYALQLCALRFMGFVPDDLSSAPPEAVAFVAQQLRVQPEVLATYGTRAQTRQDHLQAIQAHLGYRRAEPQDFHALARWLLERALEHDKPIRLYEQLCEKLCTDPLLRPGVTRLERLVAEARARAQTETYRQLTPRLTADCKQWLDSLLQPDPTRGSTPLTWLRRAAITHSPRAILDNLDKLTFLRTAGVEAWALEVLTPNRLKFLAHVARQSNAPTLQRALDERRYPILVAFLSHALADGTDEVIEMFDRCLAEAYRRAGQDLEDFRTAMANATNDKGHLFRALAYAVLDPAIDDPHRRSTISQRITPTGLRRAAVESDRMVRPLDDNYVDFFETRYGYLRQFTPTFLAAVTFHSHHSPEPLLEAVEPLQQLNRTHRRGVPQEAPTNFVTIKWRPYVVKPDGAIDRHDYALWTRWELRGALRAGNVWVSSSRRYANPDTYLIPKAKWPSLRPAICQARRIPENGAARLEERGRELHELRPQVHRLLAGHRSVGEVRVEKGRVVVPPLEAEEQPASVTRLEEAVTSRLPLIDLPALLIAVDQGTDVAKALRHLSGQEPRRSDLLPTLYAALRSQGGHFGCARMAQMADISADRLAWCTAWHLREETLEEATTTLVNFHHGLPLAQHWGGGTLSSSDGQRIPVAGKIRNATALPRYFRHQGLTYYTWTSDQLSQYGTKVIPATVRDATYVLDAILDNETDLTLVEHAPDTAG